MGSGLRAFQGKKEVIKRNVYVNQRKRAEDKIQQLFFGIVIGNIVVCYLIFTFEYLVDKVQADQQRLNELTHLFALR